jgi:hypothetical protein
MRFSKKLFYSLEREAIKPVIKYNDLEPREAIFIKTLITYLGNCEKTSWTVFIFILSIKVLRNIIKLTMKNEKKQYWKCKRVEDYVMSLLNSPQSIYMVLKIFTDSTDPRSDNPFNDLLFDRIIYFKNA